MIRLFALDVDGVLTDGQLYYSAQGETLKAFHAHDGMGLYLLQEAGIDIAVISGRTSEALIRRLDELQIKHQILSCKDKASALKKLSDELSIPMGEIAFMGDDLHDMPAMEIAGLALAPKNAIKEVRQIANYVPEANGGFGAVRQVCDYIMMQNGSSLVDVFNNLSTKGIKQ